MKRVLKSGLELINVWYYLQPKLEHFLYIKIKCIKNFNKNIVFLIIWFFRCSDNSDRDCQKKQTADVKKSSRFWWTGWLSQNYPLARLWFSKEYAAENQQSLSQALDTLLNGVGH